MNGYNVIGDVAGNYLTLMALLDKMPKDAELICLGDPNDRGPRSKEVIEYLMNNGRTVNSNHAHMFVEAWKQRAMPGSYPKYYEDDIFFFNGGNQTLVSYAKNPLWGEIGTIETLVPREHIKFLENCPMYIRENGFMFSHAPLAKNRSPDMASNIGTGFSTFNTDFNSEESLLWNRYVPNKPHKSLDGDINIFGHNSSDMVKVYTTQYPIGIKVDEELLKELLNANEEYPVYAICLDTSSVKVLTGLHTPTMTLYTQEYID